MIEVFQRDQDVQSDPIELMRRAQEKVASRDTATTTPVAQSEERIAAAWASAHRAIGEAERFTEVGSTLPPMSAISGLRRLVAVPVGRLILRLSQLFLRDQRSFNVETIAALRTLADTLGTHVRDVESRLAATAEAHERVMAESSHRNEAQRAMLAERLEGLDRASREAAGERAAAAERSAATELDLAAAREDLARLERSLGHLAEENARLRTQLLVHERCLTAQTEARATAGNGGASSVAAKELDHLLDAFYVSFEDRFRGPRDAIKERVAVYLPVIQDAGAGTPERPVIDLGCGRGEWLEVLAEAGLRGSGVDLNRAMVTESQGRGLAVDEADALGHLRGLADASCGAVTAFHLLEHLPFPVVVSIVDEVLRVLHPGGIAIFETPNPQNFLVGASSFYVDPTHRNPLHPATMAFLAEARGLQRIEIRYLHPVEDKYRLPDDGSPVVSRINEYFFGPQDFALIAHRP